MISAAFPCNDRYARCCECLAKIRLGEPMTIERRLSVVQLRHAECEVTGGGGAAGAALMAAIHDEITSWQSNEEG